MGLVAILHRTKTIWGRREHLPEDAMEDKVEVLVGRRVHVSDGRPQFLGEKVRFKGKQLGHYVASDKTDESRLKRKETFYVLYQCPGGYRVQRTEMESRRRRERARWTRVESFTTLLPVADGEGSHPDQGSPSYGIYGEEEARRAYPDLFSAVGLPNVRELD